MKVLDFAVSGHWCHYGLPTARHCFYRLQLLQHMRTLILMPALLPSLDPCCSLLLPATAAAS